MQKYFFEQVEIKLHQRPKQLINLEQWLFVTINTAKSMIDNTDKTQFAYLTNFMKCDTTRDIQQLFDKIQGKFGTKNFFFVSVNYFFSFSFFFDLNWVISSFIFFASFIYSGVKSKTYL